MTVMSVADWKALQRNEVPTKYGNKRVVVDGWPFDSKLEAARYSELKLLRKSGAVKWFICQVPFRLPGGIIYRADFVVVWAASSPEPKDEQVTVEDCKGARTSVSINKIKQVEELYGIKVTIITRK
jgi:uncharacterized protein DUF1064